MRGVDARPYRRLDIFERDGWRCQLCRRPVKRAATVPHPLAPTIDHVIPLALGGPDAPENVQCACFECNTHKSHGVLGPGEQLRLIG
jgi:5-methylcytosine-specific restriction endonuclease McrA